MNTGKRLTGEEVRKLNLDDEALDEFFYHLERVFIPEITHILPA